jgi:adenylate kinase
LTVQCVVVLGRQGSGKGEQAGRLAARLGLDHVSTGELLRQATREGTALGDACAVSLAKGEPVEDGIVAGIVAAKIAEAAMAGRGVVLDGYPRTVGQAERLAQLLAPGEVDLAVHIDVPRSVAVERIQNRRVCSVCRATGTASQCQRCGGATERRADDWPAAIGRRMSDHARDIGPLLAWFRARGSLVEVDGTGTPDDVAGRIAESLLAAHGTKVPARGDEWL